MTPPEPRPLVRKVILTQSGWTPDEVTDRILAIFATPAAEAGAEPGLDVTKLARAVELVVGDDIWTDAHLRDVAEQVAANYGDLVKGLPTADEVRGILTREPRS